MLQSASSSHLVLFLYYGISHESWFMILVQHESVPDVSTHTGTEPIFGTLPAIKTQYQEPNHTDIVPDGCTGSGIKTGTVNLIMNHFQTLGLAIIMFSYSIVQCTSCNINIEFNSCFSSNCIHSIVPCMWSIKLGFFVNDVLSPCTSGIF